MADLVGLNRKPPEKYTPQEIAHEVAKDWLSSSQPAVSNLERLIVAAIRFEREQCARVVEHGGHRVTAAMIRERTPGMEKKRPGAVILRGIDDVGRG